MKKGVVLVLCISLLLLVACGTVPQGETASDTSSAANAVKIGTQGVTLTPHPSLPPRQIWDQNELVAVVEIQNKGNHHITPNSCYVSVTGFDPSIIKGNFQPRDCTENTAGTFDGKTLYNIEGTTNQIEFKSSDITLPGKVLKLDQPLLFSTCYNYQTTASPSICIDPVFYQISKQEKVCQARDVSGGGGQGGPVGVSYVNVDMPGGKAFFEITIRNFGNGQVLSPFSDIRTCGLGGIDYTEEDKVAYNVDLSGASLISCTPGDGIVRLTNGQGKIFCTFDIQGTTAYISPLLVDLNYNYRQSIKKQLEIIKTPE
jgi:hypothetical protein